jgi:apolipoprotein N-acyltransferase
MRDRLDQFEGLVRDLGCPVLAGGSTQASPAGQRQKLRRNSAILYQLDSRGRLEIAQVYSKSLLVPFGEYVPFGPGDSFEILWLHRWLRSFVPESMPQLEPGSGPVSFSLAPKSQARFAVPICYEGVFDRYCRNLAYRGGRKQADLLVNISNDGWFIHVQPGRSSPSTELDQHLAQYVFRAIENRLPVVRAVNVGISGQIDSNGRIIKVVRQDDRKAMVAGTLVAQTLVDSRRSPYSLVGDGFAYLVCLVAVVGAALLVRASFLDRKGG